MTVLKPGRSVCKDRPSPVEKEGYFVVIDDRQATRVFFCREHLMAALRQRLIPLRTVGQGA